MTENPYEMVVRFVLTQLDHAKHHKQPMSMFRFQGGHGRLNGGDGYSFHINVIAIEPADPKQGMCCISGDTYRTEKACLRALELTRLDIDRLIKGVVQAHGDYATHEFSLMESSKLD